ncbi:MAG: lectin like domain-containing protein [Aminivibrio sp.]|uniref:lectin like domain-containing protein n=1 Tax=Aminivibrio sp. TaxID=1872489 RepID=UPI002B20CAB7|nr:lectin like domain-containing protein [Aminivibrio sp.]MEA4952664.1 lectin like domain-containing protein [Aminivibrio sp.]
MKKTAVFAAAALFLFTAAALPSPAAGPSLAPLNPAFLRDRALPGGGEAELRRSVFFAGERRPSGKRPSPLNLDHLRGRGETVRYLAARTFREDAAFPSRFDLREQGKLSPIRDQDPYGTCWTFAAMAALESPLLPGETADFSEWHLAYWAYNDTPDGFPAFTVYDGVGLFDQGGDDWKAMAVLARGTGPVNESDLPYGGPLPSEKPRLPRQKLLTSALYMPYPAVEIWRDGYPYLAVEEVKDALMNRGAVSIGMMADFNEDTWNGETGAFFYSGPRGANHAVNIVGWDDHFPRERFATRPAGDGAWIVRNSWGTSFGEAGYFYMSYEDTSLDSGIVYLASPAGEYGIIHQYDPLGWIRSVSPLETPAAGTPAWMANVFTTEESQVLRAVSFYVPDYGTEYEITIGVLSGPTPADKESMPLRGQRGVLEKPGYHTVALGKQVYLPRGTRFSVEVKVTAPEYGYPLPVEAPVAGYSDRASAEPGQSFCSADGETWIDLTGGVPGGNFCLKALGQGAESGGCSTGAPSLSAVLLLAPFGLVLIRKGRSRCRGKMQDRAR